MDDHQKKQFQFSGVYVLLAFAGLLLVQGIIQRQSAPRPVPMSELVNEVAAGKVSRVLIRDTDIVAERRPAKETEKPERIVATRLPGMDETELVRKLQEKGVEFSGLIEQTNWLETFIVAWVLPLLLFGGIWFFLMRRMQRGGPLNIGRKKARIYDETKQARATFEDVAGVDEAEGELVEVVDFLKNPQRYTALGALCVDHANPVHRVTIIPRSIGALGVTLQLPTEDRYLVTREELLDRICVLFGGRVAEEVVFGEISTGAHDDLGKATETARQMVMRLGMSEALGPQTFGRADIERIVGPAVAASSGEPADPCSPAPVAGAGTGGARR